jgi:hypothetical protein
MADRAHRLKRPRAARRARRALLAHGGKEQRSTLAVLSSRKGRPVRRFANSFLIVAVTVAVAAAPAAATKGKGPEPTLTTSTTTTTTAPTTTTTPPPPAVYDGVNDGVVPVTKPFRANVVSVRYDGGSNFILQSLDAKQQPVDLLVKTNGAYHGIVALDYRTGQDTAFFRVTASGPWHMEIRDVNRVRRFALSIDGDGDDVIIYEGRRGIGSIMHNGSGDFVVMAFGSRGKQLVKQVGAYSGLVRVDAGRIALGVRANGHWSITVGCQKTQGRNCALARLLEKRPRPS